MRVTSQRRDWLVSFSLFALILLALVIAVLLQVPPDATLP